MSSKVTARSRDFGTVTGLVGVCDPLSGESISLVGVSPREFPFCCSSNESKGRFGGLSTSSISSSFREVKVDSGRDF